MDRYQKTTFLKISASLFCEYSKTKLQQARGKWFLKWLFSGCTGRVTGTQLNLNFLKPWKTLISTRIFTGTSPELPPCFYLHFHVAMTVALPKWPGKANQLLISSWNSVKGRLVVVLAQSHGSHSSHQSLWIIFHCLSRQASKCTVTIQPNPGGRDADSGSGAGLWPPTRPN